MLAQVDFIVETIGSENLELDDEMRSNLLQLLLAIANLNEQIRHQASLAL
jgi:flagellar biosynthesis regulator FlaF